MTLGLTIIGASAGVLVLLLTLFKVEESQGRRVILSSLREHLDLMVVWCSQKYSYFFGHVGSGVFRATFHYLLHTILEAVILVLTKVRGYLSHLQLRNKRVAKVVKHKSHESHLDAIASYKEEMSLSEEEKRKRRLH